jgi:hypothetical protein
MTCITSEPNGALAVASLIRVLAWRRSERSGATRSRSRQGPASASSTADRRTRGPSPAAAARTPLQNRVLAGSVEDGVAGWNETTVLVFA